MSRHPSRRDFLKIGSLALAANFAPSWAMWTSPKDETSQAGGKLLDPPTTRMGRVLASSVAVYDGPERGAKRLAYWERDEAFMITGEVRTQGLNAHNDLWYETENGYVFSAWVQPMLKYPSQPTYNDLGEWGAWGEICKPFATARVAPNAAAAEKYRYYFGTTCHWRLWRRLYPEQLARRYADHNLLRY